jgi:hypothetical protein
MNHTAVANLVKGQSGLLVIVPIGLDRAHVAKTSRHGTGNQEKEERVSHFVDLSWVQDSNVTESIEADWRVDRPLNNNTFW